MCERKIVPRDSRLQKPFRPQEAHIIRRLMKELNDREFEYAAAEIVHMMDNRFF